MARTKRGWEPRKRPVQDRSRETVGYVLEAAAQLFGELGYGGTTTNRVAERAGVSIGTVYQYFPNKDALISALAERHVAAAGEGFTALLRELREEGLPPEGFFRGFVGAVVDFHRREERLQRLFFEEAPRTGRLGELASELGAALATEVERYLRELGLGGADPALKAAVLVEMVVMLVHQVVLDPPPGRSPEACAEEVVAACLGYVGYPLGTSTTEVPQR